jgi:hypothetical protein
LIEDLTGFPTVPVKELQDHSDIFRGEEFYVGCGYESVTGLIVADPSPGSQSDTHIRSAPRIGRIVNETAFPFEELGEILFDFGHRNKFKLRITNYELRLHLGVGCWV